MTNDNSWQTNSDDPNSNWNSLTPSNPWDTPQNPWDTSATNTNDSSQDNSWQRPDDSYLHNHQPVEREEDRQYIQSSDDDTHRFDVSKSKFQNINNLNGLKSGLNTMDESSPVNENSNYAKPSASSSEAEKIDVKALFANLRSSNVQNEDVNPNNNSSLNGAAIAGAVAAGAALGANTTTNNLNNASNNVNLNNTNPTNTTSDDKLKNLFQSFPPEEKKEPQIKIIKHPFTKAKKRIMKFVKISAVAVGTLIALHNFSTPLSDTKGMTEAQIEKLAADEAVLSAGIGNIELVGYKAIRLFDNTVPSFFDTLLTKKYNPLTTKFLSPDTLRSVDQASLNKMLKDFPAYPEANHGFLIEDPRNREVRVNIMTNLINNGHFTKHGSVMLNHLEDNMFQEAIQKNAGAAINQTTSYPFKYADAGLVGTKAPADGGRNFTATGRLSDTVPENASSVKGFVALGDYVTVPVSFTYKYLASPLIKMSGLFKSDDSLNEYTKDANITSVKGYLTATNTLSENSTFDNLNYAHLSKEENEKLRTLSQQSKYEKDGGSSIRKIAEMDSVYNNYVAKKAREAKKKEAQAQAKAKKMNENNSSKSEQHFSVDKTTILNNVKAITQPAQENAEAAKAKGLEIIKDIQRAKP